MKLIKEILEIPLSHLIGVLLVDPVCTIHHYPELSPTEWEGVSVSLSIIHHVCFAIPSSHPLLQQQSTKNSCKLRNRDTDMTDTMHRHMESINSSPKKTRARQEVSCVSDTDMVCNAIMAVSLLYSCKKCMKVVMQPTWHKLVWHILSSLCMHNQNLEQEALVPSTWGQRALCWFHYLIKQIEGAVHKTDTYYIPSS